MPLSPGMVGRGESCIDPGQCKDFSRVDAVNDKWCDDRRGSDANVANAEAFVLQRVSQEETAVSPLRTVFDVADKPTLSLSRPCRFNPWHQQSGHIHHLTLEHGIDIVLQNAFV